MILRQSGPVRLGLIAICLCLCFCTPALASYGDRLPEFKQCVNVCLDKNCRPNSSATIPLLHRLLFWTCPAECDQACQHIITNARIAADEPVVQFHGKWPFHRFLGMQEPFSVLFSLLNFLAHYNGLSKLRKQIPSNYPLLRYYAQLAYIGMASWTFSMIFHTRDFTATEQLDYFAAAASVLYGLYYTPIRVFRLDQGGAKTKSILRVWTVLCSSAYVAHVTYLKWYSWDYSYNMAANVVAGILQNLLWSWFSINKYRKSKRIWAAWPGLVVIWVLCAMSLELLDFPPLMGGVDAHSLWHLGTVAPTVLFYNFLLKDAEDDLASQRLKA